MKAADLRKKTSQELGEELTSLLREQFNLRMQQSGGQNARPDQFNKVRKNIARVKTVMNEKKSAGEA
jgi:large subunit ribosomal protein L29